VRLTGLDLGPWARYLPSAAQVRGTADADVMVTAALGRTFTAKAVGQAGIARLSVDDGARRVLGVERAEALGIDVQWPSRVAVARVRVRQPVATLERNADGALVLPAVTGPRETKQATTKEAKTAEAKTAATDPTEPADFAPPVGDRWRGQVEIGEVAVENGTLGWSDASVKPGARFQFAGVRATVRDVAWPLRGPVQVDVRTGLPGGGGLTAAGRVGVDPLTADLRVSTRGADLAPYRPYVPIEAGISGRTDMDLTVMYARVPEPTATVTGRAAVSRLAVLDGQRRVVTVEGAEATGIDVAWPTRVGVERLTIRRPWALVERDEKGNLPLRTLLTPRRAAPETTETASAGRAADTSGGTGGTGNGGSGEERERLAIKLGRITVEDGGARFMDRTLTPAYSEDLSRLTMRVDGLATGAAKPARVEVGGRLGPSAELTLHGVVGALGRPLFIEMDGELRDFAIPRVNPYMQRFLAWAARDGRLTTTVSYRVEGDRLEARNNLRFGQLRVVRAGRDDVAKQRVGLPLGMIVALMKNSRGDINISLPVGGRLSDPRFDFHEAIWGAVRRVAINTIALPVSWIGRIHYTRDAKIEDITIHPTPFEAGTTTLTRPGDEQLGRLIAFMKSSPDAKMVLTPVITVGDIDSLRQQELQEAIDRLSKETHVTPEVAAATLFTQRFPGREPPAKLDEIIQTLAQDEEPPEKAAGRLASNRLDTVRTALKKSGVDTDRLHVNKDAEGAEIGEGGRVEFGLTDQVKPKRHLLAELLRKLRELIAARLGRPQTSSLSDVTTGLASTSPRLPGAITALGLLWSPVSRLEVAMVMPDMASGTRASRSVATAGTRRLLRRRARRA
jgi:hypothetical protein